MLSLALAGPVWPTAPSATHLGGLSPAPQAGARRRRRGRSVVGDLLEGLVGLLVYDLESGPGDQLGHGAARKRLAAGAAGDVQGVVSTLGRLLLVVLLAG
jgi:hypothetical protein